MYIYYNTYELFRLLPDDVIEIINKKLIEAQNNEKKKKEKRKKKKRKWQSNINVVKSYQEKAYCKYNNISYYEFCRWKIPYIKINFIDSRFNEFVSILFLIILIYKCL